VRLITAGQEEARIKPMAKMFVHFADQTMFL